MKKVSTLTIVLFGLIVPHLPSFFSLGHFFQSLPISLYVALCLAAMIVSCWVFRTWATVGIAVLFVASWVTALSGLLLRPDRDIGISSRLSVITWNTHYWDQADGAEDFASQLRQLDADVVLLQEHVYRNTENGGDLHVIDDAIALKNCCGFEHVWTKGELVIASHIPGTPVAVDDPHIQAITLDKGDRTLKVINVHVPVHVNIAASPINRDFWSFVSERHHMRLASFSKLERLLSEADTAIVGGDFNSTVLMRPLRSALFFHTDMGVTDVWPPTYPSGKVIPEFWRLDILVGKNAGPRTCFVMPLPSEMSSDHRPVRCEFDSGIRTL